MEKKIYEISRKTINPYSEEWGTTTEGDVYREIIEDEHDKITYIKETWAPNEYSEDFEESEKFFIEEDGKKTEVSGEDIPVSFDFSDDIEPLREEFESEEIVEELPAEWDEHEYNSYGTTTRYYTFLDRILVKLTEEDVKKYREMYGDEIEIEEYE